MHPGGGHASGPSSACEKIIREEIPTNSLCLSYLIILRSSSRLGALKIHYVMFIFVSVRQKQLRTFSFSNSQMLSGEFTNPMLCNLSSVPTSQGQLLLPKSSFPMTSFMK